MTRDYVPAEENEENKIGGERRAKMDEQRIMAKTKAGSLKRKARKAQ